MRTGAGRRGSQERARLSRIPGQGEGAASRGREGEAAERINHRAEERPRGRGCGANKPPRRREFYALQERQRGQ